MGERSGLRVNMGTVEQTPHRGSHKQGVERKRDRDRCSVGDGHTKNLRPRKVIERNTEKRGAPTDSKGTAQGETDPHTGIGMV